MRAQSHTTGTAMGRNRWRQLLLVVAWVLATASCAPPEPVRIGFLGGLSGRVADLGIGGRNGAEDDQQDPEVAKQAVARLLARPVEVIIGPMTSAMAMAVVPQINGTTVPLISPTVTTNGLTGIDDQFFRVVAPTARHVFKSADHHYRQLGLRRIVLVCDLRNKAYADSWAGDFRRAFVALGGTIADEVGFAADDALSTVATRALASRPDGVVIIANSVDTGLLVQQIRLRDRQVRLATAEWAATERLIELGGQAVEGLVVAQYVDRQNRNPAYLAFRKAYRERFAHEPGFAGLTAFDATNVALDALASRQKQQTLKQALLAHGDFVGVQSPIRFDAKGDTERDTFLSRIHDGEFQSLP